MTILEAVSSADQLDGQAVVYTPDDPDSWTPESPCVLITEEDVNRTIIERNGQVLHYFLEIPLIREVKEGWDEISTSGWATPEQMAGVVIYYARFDSWPPPSSESADDL